MQLMTICIWTLVASFIVFAQGPEDQVAGHIKEALKYDCASKSQSHRKNFQDMKKKCHYQRQSVYCQAYTNENTYLASNLILTYILASCDICSRELTELRTHRISSFARLSTQQKFSLSSNKLKYCDNQYRISANSCFL